MDPKKLVTLTFAKNVGTGDRIQRAITGCALVAAGWLFPVPLSATVALSVFGVMWTATGLFSRCSIYYLAGHSTCSRAGPST